MSDLDIYRKLMADITYYLEKGHQASLKEHTCPTHTKIILVKRDVEHWLNEAQTCLARIAEKE